MLGILSFGYLHSVALPFGCLLGVICGWWYQEIWQSAVDSYHRGVAKTRFAWERTITFLLTPTTKLKRARFDVGPYLKLLHLFLFMLLWVLRRPIVLVQWGKKHPMNRAALVRIFATICFVSLSLPWMFQLEHWCGAIVEAAGKDSLVSIIVLPMVFLPLILIAVPIFLNCHSYDDTDLQSMGSFYRDWSQYSRGAFWYFYREVRNLLLYQVSITLLLAGIVIWFLGAGGLFVLFIIAPISATVGVAKGIYKVSMRAGHWLCFGVTIVVTALTAWIVNPYFVDSRVLWLAALFAGLSSAVATEGTRRLLVRFFSANRKTQMVVARTLYEQLAPSSSKFVEVTEQVRDKLFPLLPMRIAIQN